MSSPLLKGRRSSVSRAGAAKPVSPPPWIPRYSCPPSAAILPAPPRVGVQVLRGSAHAVRWRREAGANRGPTHCFVLLARSENKHRAWDPSQNQPIAAPSLLLEYTTKKMQDEETTARRTVYRRPQSARTVV